MQKGRLGKGIADLGLVKGGKVVEAVGDVGVARPEGRLGNRQRAPVERRGLGIASLGLVERGEVVEAGGDDLKGFLWPGPLRSLIVSTQEAMLRDWASAGSTYPPLSVT